ncbi:hypothetical protein WMC41_11965 [Shinella yambaruensis]|uniref:hypothetical protein n=1 Tax=Shinella yambaruensis TaxID=415996 RepID=UPI003D7BB0C0
MNIQRHKIERAIDVLIALLDTADGDPDLEPYLSGIDMWGDDREAEHDGREPDEDGEPDLGWTESIMQGGPSWRGSGWGADFGCEHDPAESGIADWGGLDEQMRRGVA